MADKLNIGKGLQSLGTILETIGKLRGAGSADAFGRAQSRAAEFEAKQLQQKAALQRAIAGRAARETRRQEKFLQSALLAQAAAQGGASDPGVIKLTGDIAAEGMFHALTALFQGESAARALETSAQAKRYGGRMSEMSSKIKADTLRGSAFGSLLGDFAGTSAFEKFGEFFEPSDDK